MADLDSVMRYLRRSPKGCIVDAAWEMMVRCLVADGRAEIIGHRTNCYGPRGSLRRQAMVVRTASKES